MTHENLSIALAGNVDSGKSSLLGVLLTGKKDDGRGSARSIIFNYTHEMKTGRTSSVGQHILGFGENGKVVNYENEYKASNWPKIVNNSLRIVTFFDLCGHEKYLKTTIFGLTSNFPDITLILVGGNMGVSMMTKEHIFLCLSLRIPFAIVITKVDICENRQNVLKQTVQDIKNIIRLARKKSYDIRKESDVETVLKQNSNIIVPIFYVSNVTERGITDIRHYIKHYNLFEHNEQDEPVLLYIEKTFFVEGVGTVVGGHLSKGTINVGDKLLLGPSNNQYRRVTIKGIHCKRVGVSKAQCGQYVCLCLKRVKRSSIRKGEVLISNDSKSEQCIEFEAVVSVLQSHSTTVQVGYEPVIHTQTIRQTSKLIEIKDKTIKKGKESASNILRTGDRAVVQFRLNYRPEYLREGFRILLAEGRVKVFGTITKVINQTVNIVNA